MLGKLIQFALTQRLLVLIITIGLAAAGAPGASPSQWVLRMMDGLFVRALSPAHELTSDRWTPLARGVLYLRGHWLRMPPGRLTLHLLRKLLPARQGV